MQLACAVQLSPLRRRRSLAAAALVAAGLAVPWSRAYHGLADDPQPTVSPPAAPASYRVVPITNYALDLAPTSACGAFVGEIAAHPHGAIQLGRAWWDCTSQGFTDVYTLTDGENLTWDAEDVPTRRLALTDAERDAIRSVATGSCERPDPDALTTGAFIASIGDLHAGPSSYAAMNGPRIPFDSPLGAALDAAITAARDRYVAGRARWLGDLHAELVAGAYLATLHGRTIVVTHDGREIQRTELEPDELVDLGDWAVADAARTHCGRGKNNETIAGRGWIVVDGHSTLMRLDRFEREPRPLRPLVDALGEAGWRP